MSGPPPKPTHIKLVAGNPGKRPINKNEPLPRTSEDIPSAPDYLNPEAAAIWDKMAGELHDCGLLTSVDEDALALYCTTFARWLWAEAKLQEPPKTVYTMTEKAEGITRDEYVAKGWTDEQLVAYGYMLEPETLDPHVMKTKSGYLAHSPYLAIANKCFDQLKALLQEFGMTPAARSRVQAAPKTKDDPMDAFLGGRG